MIPLYHYKNSHRKDKVLFIHSKSQLSLPAEPEVVILKTSGAASNDNFIKSTFSSQNFIKMTFP